MPRILVAEDDSSLLQLTTELLSKHANVDAAGDISTAVRQLAEREYDLLLTDLNLDHPGGGLILAGANRALHPVSRNALLTGDPDFAAALMALRSTLDQVLLKPVEASRLVELAQSLGHPLAPAPQRKGTVQEVIGRSQREIMEQWFHLTTKDPILGRVPLSREQRLDHLDGLLQALSHNQPRTNGERSGAMRHGRQRRDLNFRSEWLSLEIAYLRRALLDVILRELGDLDLTRFAPEMFALNERLDRDMLDSLSAFGLQ